MGEDNHNIQRVLISRRNHGFCIEKVQNINTFPKEYLFFVMLSTTINVLCVYAITIIDI